MHEFSNFQSCNAARYKERPCRKLLRITAHIEAQRLGLSPAKADVARNNRFGQNLRKRGWPMISVGKNRLEGSPGEGSSLNRTR